MDKDRVTELHFITSFENVASILATGIRCHNHMKTLEHKSVADPEVQVRRASKKVPGGLKLHDYANLYFDARNVMMYVLPKKNEIAVIRVSRSVLEVPGVVIADRNAASGAASFRPVATGIELLDEDAIYAEWWNESYDARQLRCAEVLVPAVVPPEYIEGIYVGREQSKDALTSLLEGPPIAIEVRAHIFFRSEDQ